MDTIENLFSLDYPSIIMGFFIIILGVDKIIFILAKVKKALRIKFGFFPSSLLNRYFTYKLDKLFFL